MTTECLSEISIMIKYEEWTYSVSVLTFVIHLKLNNDTLVEVKSIPFYLRSSVAKLDVAK